MELNDQIIQGKTPLHYSWIIALTEVMIFYVATGIGSGLANAPMMGLVSFWLCAVLTACGVSLAYFLRNPAQDDSG